MGCKACKEPARSSLAAEPSGRLERVLILWYEQIIDAGDVQLDIGGAMEHAIAAEKQG